MPKLILLVEDDSDDIELTLRAFRKHKLDDKVKVVEDGVAALNYLFCKGDYGNREPGDQPVVVLLDLKLPKIDGLDVLKHIRTDERTRLLPVVVLTSSKEERDIAEAYLRGANSYIQKPVSYEELIDATKKVGDYWLGLNVAPPCIAKTSSSPQ